LAFATATDVSDTKKIARASPFGEFDNKPLLNTKMKVCSHATTLRTAERGNSLSLSVEATRILQQYKEDA